jgi:hypothetical protein
MDLDQSNIAHHPPADQAAEPAQHFRLVDFNQTRHFRGKPAARVEVDPDGEWLWMTAQDVRLNIRDFGDHPELQKALQAYGVRA